MLGYMIRRALTIEDALYASETVCDQMTSNWPIDLNPNLATILYFDNTRHMDEIHAVDALSALAQTSRLQVFRLLVRNGPAGLAAGEIALKLAIPHNTLSTHLAILTRAGLLNSTRFGRSIVYRIDPDGIRQLLNHLIQDCCNGKPELCGPLLSSPPARRRTATA